MVNHNIHGRSGLEVYETKDSNKESSYSSDSNNQDSETEGFVLHNGEITEIAYYDNMIDNSYDYDYEDISSNASITLDTIDDKRFYKGKKVCLKKGIERNKMLKWDDLSSVLLGFITEQTFSQDNVDLKIVGMTKLLEQEKQFSFTNTKRSVILKNMIESAGLKCNINTKGLKDEKINYTNVSSNSNGSSGSGDADLDKWVQDIIGSETDDLKKAERIHNGLCKVLHYTGYRCSKYNSVSSAWKSKKLNCADTSRVSVAAFKSVGLDAQVVHGPNHFWTIITINGKEYASDATSGRRKFNTVLNGLSYSKKNGDEPEC